MLSPSEGHRSTECGLAFIHVTDLGIGIKIDNRCVMIDQRETLPVQCGGRLAFAGIINVNGMGRELR